GDPEPSPDNLMLDRRCWLDYDGRGLTCRDTLTGTMRRNFHLSVDQPFSLGQATLNGVPQVITWQRNSKGQSAPGLQLRQGALHLTADLRIEGFDHALPASGWDHNLDRTNQFLVLPPGYELLRVSGAMALDRFYGPSAWWDRWNAFDMFMVLAVVLAALKLLGLPWAILALAAMSLSYHEFLAPRLVLLHVLGATALLAVLPPGKASLAARIWRIGSVIFMIFCAAALIILQARLAMYPQLENPDVRRTGPGWPLLSRTFLPDSFESLQYAPYAADDAGVEAASFEGMAMEAPAPMAERALRKSVAAPPPPEPFLSQTSRPKAASLIAQSLNPELMAQNTLARPEWGFRLISLDFNDQVSKDQRAELSIIGPGANKLLRILRIVLLAWLVLALAAGRSGPRGFLGPLARLVPKPGGSKGTPPGPGAEGGAVQDAGAAKKSHEPMAPTQGAGRAPGPPSGQGHSLTASQSATPGQALAGLSALVLSGFSDFFSIAKHSLSSFFASLPPFFLAAILSIAALSGSAWAQDAFPSYEAEGPASAAAKPQAPTAPAAAFSSGLFPSPELLRELKERLLKEEVLPAPSIPLISIGPGEASGSIRLRVDFEAAESSLLPLPIIDEEIARFTKVYLSSTGGDLPLARGRDSVVLALIPEGADSVVIDCLLLPSPGFQLRFSLIPKRVELLSLPGYSLQGLGPEGHPLAGSVFVETGKIEEAPESEVDQALASGGQSLEPFFMVDRVLSLGLDWKVMTTVTRYGNAGAPATVSIPLLESESPTTMGLTVSGGRAVLNFRPGESHKFFESSYPVNLDSELTLTASDGPYAESWRLDAANIWRVETSSLVPIHTLSPDGLFNPQWRPWPGESLTLKVTRPEPVPGAYLVIDKATVKTVAGEENRKHTLTASLRSSKGGAHSIFLPAGVEIQSFSLGGKTLPIGAPLSSNRGLEVSVPLVPGEKTLEIAFLETADLESITRMPAIDLGLPSANIHYELDLPDDRWLLFARGPIQGPAVLFWSFAGAMLVLSLLLARIGSTPLGTISWLLILVGLSQLSLAGAFVVAGWLLALGLRGSKPPLKDAQSFNAAQILLAFWTIVALVLIYQGLQHALLEAPSMRVAGNASTEHQLRWFADRAQGPLPDAWALTISNKVYQFVMLAWALWLAISIIRWLRWGWRCFSSEGFWRKEPKAPKPPKSPRGPAGPPPGFGPPPG
ncbi:MAG: hypothetical protein LBE49_08200, partial [Deltaproteobacteria bacterium]|nr:hypothetical protein [Deltaproteobacteria bacterium]